MTFRAIRQSKPALLAIVAVVLGAAIFVAPRVFADLLPNMSTYSPAYYGSANGVGDANMTRHLMILSDHGNVSTITTGLYWDTPGQKTVHIYAGNQGNGNICDIYNAKSAQNSDHPLSNIYLQVQFTSITGAPKTYLIRGDRICGPEGTNRLTTTSATARFYGSYAVPPNVVGAAKDPGTGKYKVRMTITFYDDISTYWSPAGGDQIFTFQVGADGGNAGLLNATSATNSSVVAKFTGGPAYIRQLLPFGLACNASSPSAPQDVTVYDADNTAAQPYPLKFYIAKVSGSGSTAKITPLAKEDYQQQGGGPRLFASGGANYLGGDDVTYNPGYYPGGYPVFRPANYSGTGGRGGFSTVWINSMKSLGDDPTAHYALVILNLHSAGTRTGNNNFISYGLPGDGIFGFSDFTCPAAGTVTPSIKFTTPASLDASPGEPVVATASIRNGGTSVANVAAANVKVWYDKVQSTAYTGVNQSLVTNANWTAGTPAGGIGNYAAGQTRSATYSTTASAGYDYVCASIDVTGGAGTVPNPAHANATCVRVTFRPYLSITGGDAVAGTSPKAGNATCSAPNYNAGFLAWNGGSATGWAGAGAQFAVQALGDITTFASAQGTVNGAAVPFGLAFANTTRAGTDKYGGGFGSVDGVNCDYTSDLTVETNPGIVPGTNSLAGHVTHYYRGNVYISGSIVYSTAGRADFSNIPSFRLVVVGGNITIDKDVTELDGTYVAEPDAAGNGGMIYTCGDPGTRQAISPTSSGYFAACRKPLSIYGSFVAKKVSFLRTAGDYTTSGPAEAFYYSPELWLGNMTADINGKDASITSLPPIL